MPSYCAGVEVETCGKMGTVQNLVMRMDGTLKMSYPSQTGDRENYQGTWEMESISVDFDGNMDGLQTLCI